jgi:hypothetical protein
MIVLCRGAESLQSFNAHRSVAGWTQGLQPISGSYENRDHQPTGCDRSGRIIGARKSEIALNPNVKIRHTLVFELIQAGRLWRSRRQHGRT